MNMLEHLPTLAVGVGNFRLAREPLAQQHRLAEGFGGDLADGAALAVAHDEDQVGVAEHLGGELAGLVARDVEAIGFGKFSSGRLDPLANQCAQASGAELPARQCAAQHRLGYGAAADVTDTNDEDAIEHQLMSLASERLSPAKPGRRIDGSSRLITRFQRASGAVVT